MKLKPDFIKIENGKAVPYTRIIKDNGSLARAYFAPDIYREVSLIPRDWDYVERWELLS